MFKKRLFGIPLAVIIPMVIIACGIVGVSAAVLYNLNKTVPATVTITTPPPPPPTEVTLYTDALCTTEIPVGYVHDFGTYEEGETPQNPLWFKAAEINPATINVTDDLDGYDVGFIIGTPMGAMPGQPCPLALYLPTDMPADTYNFNFTVTGTGP